MGILENTQHCLQDLRPVTPALVDIFESQGSLWNLKLASGKRRPRPDTCLADQDNRPGSLSGAGSLLRRSAPEEYCSATACALVK